MLKFIYTILVVVLISSCSSSDFEFDPGACPRAAIMSGSETSMFNGLKIELNRTVMICEYNVKRKKIDFNIGVIGDVINQDQLSVDEFRGQLLETISNDVPLETPNEIGLTKAETKRFSVMRAINALSGPMIPGFASNPRIVAANF